MAKRKFPKPTEAELAILRVLWERGPCTVRVVTDALQKERGTGYTTALKLMQIMTEKGLLRRDDSGWIHIFEAAVSAAQTQKQLVGDLVDRAFGGSAQKLVMQALSSRRASREELAEIRRLIEELEEQSK